MSNLTKDSSFLSQLQEQIVAVKKEIDDNNRKWDLLQKLLQLEKKRTQNPAQLSFISDNGSSDITDEEPVTIREKIIDVIRILGERKNGRSVRLREILEYVNTHDIALGNSKNYNSLVSSILSQEIEKKENSLVRKIKRGYYKLK